jgi:hypothetical protein
LRKYVVARKSVTSSGKSRLTHMRLWRWDEVRLALREGYHPADRQPRLAEFTIARPDSKIVARVAVQFDRYSRGRVLTVNLPVCHVV